MPVKEYLMPEDTSKIEAAALWDRDKLLIRLLRRLGCRVGEVLGIEVRHIDFEQRQVRIEHEKHFKTLFCPHCRKAGKKHDTRLAKTHLFCPICRNPVEAPIVKMKAVPNLRKIPLDKDSLALIKAYIKSGGVTEVNGKKLLFAFSRQTAWKIVKDCAVRAGFSQLENPANERKHHVSPHKFRDSFAINVIKKRPSLDDARLLQEMLGHASINTTLLYRKVGGEELQEFYDSIIEEES